MTNMKIVFLGTGGGRYTTITQTRKTAGIRILTQNQNIHIDPGPGALIHSIQNKLNPQKLTAILITHAHPDHYTDAEILIEAMTKGMTKKKGVLMASHSVLKGNQTCGPAISKYHQQKPQTTLEAKPNTTYQLNNLKITATKAEHTDPDTIGFYIETPDIGNIAYTSDTQHFQNITKHYQNTRLLILCVMRPTGKPWKGHMTTDDAIKILNETKPETAIITHFGMQMIFKGPNKEAKLIEKETKIPTIAAKDGMCIEIDEEIHIKPSFKKEPQTLNKFIK